ncbi:alanine racemase [Parasphingopyxis sp.]|uniref:alanine racemase n=1 Tax=Parasphingopyxis sp. TaxID=1920299 RepID=UPI002621CEB6|nr:alanine racemase [Parasphingopyxis sp.]
MNVNAIGDIETPALILDHAKLAANIVRMAARADELGVALRPHLKTPKSAPVAQMLADAGANGFCVSTLREAEYFFAADHHDLFYCVPFAPAKMPRASALIAKGCALTLMTDSLEGAKACIAAAEACNNDKPVPFALEVDVDGYRSGADMAGLELIEAARAFDRSTATSFAGIMSYGGASYGCTPAGAAALAERHVEALASVETRLAEADLVCPMVSFGSTPAILHARQLPGVTETRCGIFMFQDLFQAGIGAARIDDIALSVLSTVIACQPSHNRLVIDAGGLALSKDRSTAGHAFDAGYGVACDVGSGRPIGDLIVSEVSQELGLVTSKSGAVVDMDHFRVGTQLRILPNHADMTAAAHDRYHVIGRDSSAIIVWRRTNGW